MVTRDHENILGVDVALIFSQKFWIFFENLSTVFCYFELEFYCKVQENDSVGPMGLFVQSQVAENFAINILLTGFSNQFPQFRFNSFAALSYLLDLADPRLQKHTKKLFFIDYLTINHNPGL